MINSKEKEIDFQDLFVKLINEKTHHKFIAGRGVPILYELKIDENLNIIGDPKNPKRGQGAFETDVSIFKETIDPEGNKIKIPIIIIEVKDRLSTHDVITYNNKAQRHKEIYPYLRYGIVCYGLDNIPKRFFKHNTDLDFFIAVNEQIKNEKKLKNTLDKFIKMELKVINSFKRKMNNKENYNFYQVIPKIKNI